LWQISSFKNNAGVNLGRMQSHVDLASRVQGNAGSTDAVFQRLLRISQRHGDYLSLPRL
jgi:hypothetical protein